LISLQYCTKEIQPKYAGILKRQEEAAKRKELEEQQKKEQEEQQQTEGGEGATGEGQESKQEAEVTKEEPSTSGGVLMCPHLYVSDFS
jgi:hypothetical protein